MLNEKQRELVVKNIGLVYSIIKKKNKCNDDDAIQWGLYGLCKAAESYDSSRGVMFSTYAYSYIINWVDGKYCEIKHNRKICDGTFVYTDDLEKYRIELMDDIDNRIYLEIALQDLDECGKKIVNMIYNGYKRKQITELLNISNTVYHHRIRKAREILRNE